jgi:hypothetical protein
MDSSGNTKTQLQLCDPYIWEDPRYIFRSTWFDRYLTDSSSVCASALVNKVFFVYIVAFLIATLASFVVKVPGIVGIAGILATVYLIPTFMKLRSVSLYKEEASKGSAASSPSPSSASSSRSEGFRPSASMQQTRPQAWGPMPDDLTGPKAAYENAKSEELDCQHNPFNNILVDEYKYSPTRAAAPPITTTASKIALDQFFRVQWSSDPTDVFGKSQSQRMFVTQPVTTIPNDQGSYQDWLYKIPGKTCKEGNPEACYGGTNGAPMPWLNL